MKLICPTRALIVRIIPIIRPATPLKSRKLVSSRAVFTLLHIPSVAVLGLAELLFDYSFGSLNKIIVSVNNTMLMIDCIDNILFKFS
jgi:hypothetical protein